MMRKRKVGLERKLRKGGKGPTHYAIDCHDFAEDDTLRGGHFSRLCFEEGTGVYADLMGFLIRMRGVLTNEIAPSRPKDAKSYAGTYPRRCPQVWTCLFKELADVERLSRACAHKVQVNNSWSL
jgi:hypothetical protein